MKHLKKFLFLSLLFLFISPVFAEVYKLDAIVSFYAEDFHGKKTSNGEIFNMYDLTCASKNFAFDTELKVTNLANGKSVIVRVNDRGPFVPDRELDLSKAAAIKLGMVASGTAHVKIEVVKPGPDSKLSRDTIAAANKIMVKRFGPDWNKSAGNSTSAKSSTQTKPSIHEANTKTVNSAPANAIFEIQVGSYSTKENAQKSAKKLHSLGFEDIFIRTSNETYKVVLKNVKKSTIQNTANKLSASGYKDFIIRVQK